MSDQWGAWAKAKPLSFCDVFPTPETLQAAADAAMRASDVPVAPVRITREQWSADPDRWTAESEMRVVQVVDAAGRVRMTLSGCVTEEADR